MTRRSELLHCISCTVGWLSQVDAYFSLTLLYNGLEKEAMYLKIINYSVLTSDCIFIQLSGKHRGRREKILTCSACRYMYGVNIARDSRNMLPVINFYPKILYSGKLSSKITCINFEVLWLLTKIFTAKIMGAWHFLAAPVSNLGKFSGIRYFTSLCNFVACKKCSCYLIANEQQSNHV